MVKKESSRRVTPTGKHSQERTARLVLLIYRAFALAIAIIQIQLVDYPKIFAWPDWIIISLTGLYTVHKITLPFSRQRSKVWRYTEITIDIIVCLSLLTLTGGLQSPFLLYGLCPVLTSALFFPRKLTFTIAALPTLFIVGSQLLIYQPLMGISFFPLEFAFGLLGAYMVGSFLVAVTPYVINISTSRRLQDGAIIEERSRLSREIHDGVAQVLGIVKWKAELLQQHIAVGDTERALEGISEIEKLVKQAQQETREAIDNLRADIGTRGFVARIAQFATDFTRDYGIKCELHVVDGQVTVPASAEMELLSIAREALTNVRKHAGASMVEVVIESKPHSVEITIRDDGRGFQIQEGARGHGLAVMEERARSLGGQLTITAGPAQGTCVKVSLPVEDKQITTPLSAIRRVLVPPAEKK